MNAQRYSPQELDDIADELRDECIRDWMVRGGKTSTEMENTYLEIQARVGLARLLRDDAMRIRSRKWFPHTGE